MQASKKSRTKKPAGQPNLRVVRPPRKRRKGAYREWKKLQRPYVEEMWVTATLILMTGYEAHGSWEAFAEVAGVHRNTIANLFNRRTRFPQYNTLLKLAKASGLNLIEGRVQE